MRSRSTHSTVLLLLLVLALAHPALACVACHSVTAHQVRQEIFGRGFLHTFVLTAAPFPVFLALAALIFFGFPLPPEHAPVSR
jgi:hypothetical protein